MGFPQVKYNILYIVKPARSSDTLLDHAVSLKSKRVHTVYLGISWIWLVTCFLLYLLWYCMIENNEE